MRFVVTTCSIQLISHHVNAKIESTSVKEVKEMRLLLLQIASCKLAHMFASFLDDRQQDPMFDKHEFESVAFQRVYQYLKIYSSNANDVNSFEFRSDEIRGDYPDCLRILLR